MIMTDVAVVLGSDSDMPVAEKAFEVLDSENIDYVKKVISAHRDPEKLVDFVEETEADVFIGIAGLSAALPGSIASNTSKPVIGVPVDAKLGGLDSLLSIVQMPKGVPVACVGIGRADNAALLAKKILRN
ncbi:MAG: Phosphoribosylcarboxyaminoimidazole (NCAIR) mutase PurE [Candidatus Methanohalarchaeum thermophilum]|uniref:N5-carboxyaminoimidazole ribonucleotide mutase n=1 Tax=Methanohalarchaeum thermophilum TaxID=1903181 RepID=A0A1Q6DUS0_METT1|nr:MAG: Phosphoribosylcarboxyaminoimidazole (NCAIR) mutase PurE [Candidatus Methanohalarchaeum thermophilum]